MSRLWKIGSLMIIAGAFAAVAGRAIADDNPPTAGHKGTVTAWNEAGDTVIDHRVCVRIRGTWDYSLCGNILRDRLKSHLCTTLGAGTHKYLYQVGDGRKMPSSVYCKK